MTGEEALLAFGLRVQTQLLPPLVQEVTDGFWENASLIATETKGAEGARYTGLFHQWVDVWTATHCEREFL